MPICLCLDANILLSFYALSNADIEQLKQLKGVVEKGDVNLIVNVQVVNEVERNREGKIKESFKALREDSFRCHAPAFVKSIPEFVELQNVLKQANKTHATLIDIVSKLVEERALEADKIIKELVTAAGCKEVTLQQHNAAFKRYLIGNPPGKKKSTIGDEINWEFLLGEVPVGDDLHLVSADSDYASATDPSKVNGFLNTEWSKTKSSTLYYYRDLNDFFKIHIPKIKIANQEKLNALIAELSGSQSFADTHSIVAKFPENPELSDAQIAELLSIRENNSQVSWIASDPDVASFYAFFEPKNHNIDDEIPF